MIIAIWVLTTGLIYQLNPQPRLLDDILGPVLHDLLASFPEYKSRLSEMFSKDVEMQPKLKHLQACKYLSTKPIDKSKCVL